MDQTAQQTPSSAQPVSPQPAMPTPAQQPTQPANGPVAPPVPQIKKSSNAMWIIMIIVILLILAVAGWFLYQAYMNKSTDSAYQDTMITPTAEPSPTVGAVKSGDQQLDKQSDAIDESMVKVETDIKGVDAGLNDKSVDLSQ